MIILNQIYKCEVCGNIVEVVQAGQGELVCCGQPMKLIEENTVDAAVEKHVPVIENLGNKKILVKVGETEHPMTEEHYIEWIEVLVDGKVFRKQLSSGNKPEAEFCILEKHITARAYCNLHGLWQSK